MTVPKRSRRPAGFTLVELLVVMSIIVLVSAATLPVVLPALEHRQVSEAARVFQAALASARDSALRANAPRGIRLLPDPTLSPPIGEVVSPISTPVDYSDERFAFVASSFVPIEAGPSYTEGLLRYAMVPGVGLVHGGGLIIVQEDKFYGSTLIPNPPTSWYWNVRVGEKIQIDGVNQPYIIRGPQLVPTGPNNPEGFVNLGVPSAGNTNYLTANSEYLILSNGIDDDGDGFVDEGFDGLDNDEDESGGSVTTVKDPGIRSNPNLTITFSGDVVNSFDLSRYVSVPAEVEAETAFGVPDDKEHSYSIQRRPVPTQGARPTPLPGNVVIDLTTWNYANPERSRLPVDPNTGYVDILMGPNGQIIPPDPGKPIHRAGTIPFYHFWLTEREDVFPPTAPPAASTSVLYLPVPSGTPNANTGDSRILEGERRLVTINTRTGLIVTNPVETFNVEMPSQVYNDAQRGIREAR